MKARSIGALVCHWCDGSEHRRSPLLWDDARDAFVHGRCARPDAILKTVAEVVLGNAHTISGTALVELAQQRPMIARVKLGRSVTRRNTP